MPAGSTYSTIQTISASASSTVSFTSIPSTYTDIVLIANAKSSASGSASNDYRIQLNGDTGSNYSETKLYGQNTGTYGSARDANQTVMYIGALSASGGSANPSIINFMNYSNTTTFKTAIAKAGNANAEAAAAVAIWRNTSAINRIDLSLPGFTLTGDFTIYGITAA